MLVILGPDGSSYQGEPDMAAVRDGGNDFFIVKVTEGLALHRAMRARGLTPHPQLELVRPSVTVDGIRHRLPARYVNPTWSVNRYNAHQAGLIVLLYHFARGNNPAAEAAYFLRTIGALQPGEGLVLDWEIPGDAAVWGKQFLDALYAQTTVRGLVYLNQSAINGYDWSPVAALYKLWAAVYDGDPWTQPAVRYWGAPIMKQYTDSAPVPGISGPCDRSAFFGTREELLALGFGAPQPGPQPTPSTVKDTDMPIVVTATGQSDVPGVGPRVPAIYAGAGTFMGLSDPEEIKNAKAAMPEVWVDTWTWDALAADRKKVDAAHDATIKIAQQNEQIIALLTKLTGSS